MLGKGAAIAIDDRDLAMVAENMDVHPADLEAIANVESRGFGWFDDGRMKILFEKHIFYKYCPQALRKKAVNSGVGRSKWISPAKGGYKDQTGAESRYVLLEKAIKIDEDTAFMAISMGKFQIMGFNYRVCGFESAQYMFDAFVQSEVHQLSAFAKFLVANGIDDAIRAGDFETVEKRYNGGGLGGEYARRMRAESNALRAGKWADYVPGGKVVNIPNMPAELPDEPTSAKPKSLIAKIVSAIITFFMRRNAR